MVFEAVSAEIKTLMLLFETVTAGIKIIVAIVVVGWVGRPPPGHVDLTGSNELLHAGLPRCLLFQHY